MGVILALLLAIAVPSSSSEDSLKNVLWDECINLIIETDADYCVYQHTDVSEEDGVITARVRFSIGCSGGSQVQEAEYIVGVRLSDEDVVRANRIHSVHLPDGGAERFTRRYCDRVSEI